jgi:hypothetical protein
VVDVQSRAASRHRSKCLSVSSLRASSQSSIPDRIFALADNINYPYSQHLGALNAVLVLLIGKKEPEKITL